MISERDRLVEWISRVEQEIKDIKRQPGTTKEERLSKIRNNYSIISVLTKVASKEAYMVGAPVIKHKD